MCVVNPKMLARFPFLFFVVLLFTAISAPVPVRGVGIKIRSDYQDLKAEPEFLEKWVEDIEDKNCWLFSYRHPKYNKEVWDLVDYDYFQRMPLILGGFEPSPGLGAGPDLKTKIEKRPENFRWATHAKYVLCFIGLMQYPESPITNTRKFYDVVTSPFFYVSPVNKSSSRAWSRAGLGGGILRPKETWLFRFESKPLFNVKDILGLPNHLGVIYYVRLTHQYFPIPPINAKPLYLQIHSVLFICPICFPGQSGLQRGEIHDLSEEMQINFYTKELSKLPERSLLSEKIQVSKRPSYYTSIKRAITEFKNMANSRNSTTLYLMERRLEEFLLNPRVKEAKRSLDLIIDKDPIDYLAFQFVLSCILGDSSDLEMNETVKFEEPEGAKSKEKSLGWFKNTNELVFEDSQYDMEPLEGNRWFLGFSERFLSDHQYQIRAYPAGSQKYKFITSDGVHSKKTGLEVYYGPFQWSVWLLLFLSILLMSNLYPLVRQSMNFDERDPKKPQKQEPDVKFLFRHNVFGTSIWIFRMMMEQPTEMPFTINAKAIVPFGKILFAVWIFMALVLSNAYRGIIKAEYAISYPWTTDWKKAEQFIDKKNDFFVYYTQANFQCESEKLTEYKGVLFNFYYTKSIFLAPFEEDPTQEYYGCQTSCGDLNRPLDVGNCKANKACKEYDRKIRIKTRRGIICPEEVPGIIRNVLHYPKHALIFREQDFDQLWKVFQLEMTHNVTTKFAFRAQHFEDADESFIKKKGFYVRFHLKPFEPDFLDRAVKVMFSSGVYWWWEELEKFKYLIHHSKETIAPVITTGKGQNSGQTQGQPSNSIHKSDEDKKLDEKSPLNSTTIAAGQKGRELEEKVKGLSFGNSDIHLIFFVFAFLIGCSFLVFLQEAAKIEGSKFKLMMMFNLKAAKKQGSTVPTSEIILVQPTKSEPIAKFVKKNDKKVVTKNVQNVVMQMRRKKNMQLDH